MPTYRRVPAQVTVADLRQAPGNDAAPEPVEEEATDYGSLKKDELVALANERGIDSSGTKADIIGRLEA